MWKKDTYLDFKKHSSSKCSDSVLEWISQKNKKQKKVDICLGHILP